MKKLIQQLNSYILNQRNVLFRLAIFRMIFSLLIIYEVLTNIDTLVFDSLLEFHYFGSPAWYEPFIEYWKILIVGLLTLNFFGFHKRWFRRLILITVLPYFYCFDFHLSSVTEPIWLYSVYLPVFLILHCFANVSAIKFSLPFKVNINLNQPIKNFDYFILFFFQIYIVNMFFQSAISKLIVTDFSWFLSGQYIFFHTLLVTNKMSDHLILNPQYYKYLGVLTFIFEFFGILLFIKSRKLYGLVAIIFHLSTWIVMDINFIFMWPVYLPVFYDLDWLRRIIQANKKEEEIGAAGWD